MKWLAMFAVLVIHFNGVAQGDITQLREMFFKASQNEQEANRMSMHLDTLQIQEKYVLMGYQAASKFLLSKYAINPYHKWTLFKQGRNLMEKAVVSLPQDIEIRYLRFTIQTHLPRMLGYDEGIEPDKKMLFHYLKGEQEGTDKGLVLAIRDALLVSGECNQDEIKSIQRKN